MVAYRQTQRSSLQFGLWIGGHLALAYIHSSDLSELSPFLLLLYRDIHYAQAVECADHTG